MPEISESNFKEISPHFSDLYTRTWITCVINIGHFFKIENCKLPFFRLILRSLFSGLYFGCLSKKLREYIYLSDKMFIISCVDASFSQAAPRRCAGSVGSMQQSCSTFLEMHSDALIPINAFSFIVSWAHNFHLRPIKVLLVAQLMFLKN